RNGGRGCQPPNSRWCFSTYEKTCIGDLRRRASISVGSVPQPKSPQWSQNQFRFSTCTKVLMLLDFSTFIWFKSMPAAFHNQQAHNGVRTNSASAPSPVFNVFN